MAVDFPIIVLNSVTYGSTSQRSVGGVFWLTATLAVPNPTAQSRVAGITSAELAALRSGAIVELPFTADGYNAGTSDATIEADLQSRFNAAQTALQTQAPSVTIVGQAFNGASWVPYPNATPAAIRPGPELQLMADIYPAVALGLLPNVVSGRAAGYVPAASKANTRIFATAYSPAAPGAAAQRSVSSSSANDAAAGTGARTVLITYLTTSFVVKTETVALNGTSTVNTVGTDIAYIESIAVATCGSGLTNAGTISLFNATAGAGGTLGSIAAGDSQTFWAHHYVPAGKTCALLNVSGGAILQSGFLSINRTGDPSQSTLPVIGIGGSYPHLTGGNEDHTFQVPITVAGPDHIIMNDFPSAATANNVAYGNFEFIEFG